MRSKTCMRGWLRISLAVTASVNSGGFGCVESESLDRLEGAMASSPPSLSGSSCLEALGLFTKTAIASDRGWYELAYVKRSPFTSSSFRRLMTADKL